ncbi:MAG: pyridoxamine 5'-phosphate oxidase family protein [Actinomycetia bacterium]|nr:pyridoxamine 5'-phosphate oxidase family protein [Actinomycetes bacterium]
MVYELQHEMESIDESECWDLLAMQELGRLAVSVAGNPDIFPVNYVVHEGRIFFRTAAGSKLASLAVNAAVAFEADDHSDATNIAWSVVVTGYSRIVDNDDEAVELENLPLRPWFISEKAHFVEIEVAQISGRRFYAAGRE